jgi:hypothetical protein
MKQHMDSLTHLAEMIDNACEYPENAPQKDALHARLIIAKRVMSLRYTESVLKYFESS